MNYPKTQTGPARPPWWVTGVLVFLVLDAVMVAGFGSPLWLLAAPLSCLPVVVFFWLSPLRRVG